MTGAAGPFHAGELAMQERGGAPERLRATAQRFIRDHMPDQHRAFFAALPLVFVGALDAARRPWASVVSGAPGFVQSPDARRLVVGALPPLGDPIRDALTVGAPVGLLGLEAQTRRRNRMNGTIVARDAGGFVVEVDQSFGNCPQYIQARAPHPAAPTAPGVPVVTARTLDGRARTWVEHADTLFIATAAAQARGHAGAAGVDVSHRGGRPGFVHVDDEAGHTVLTVPDFRGNFFFNTLGNVLSNPRAGLLFVDYVDGGLLQVTGAASVVFDPAALQRYPGALRLLRVQVDEARRIEAALPLTWSAPAPASQLEGTGPWRDATRTQAGLPAT